MDCMSDQLTHTACAFPFGLYPRARPCCARASATPGPPRVARNRHSHPSISSDGTTSCGRRTRALNASRPSRVQPLGPAPGLRLRLANGREPADVRTRSSAPTAAHAQSRGSRHSGARWSMRRPLSHAGPSEASERDSPTARRHTVASSSTSAHRQSAPPNVSVPRRCVRSRRPRCSHTSTRSDTALRVYRAVPSASVTPRRVRLAAAASATPRRVQLAAAAMRPILEALARGGVWVSELDALETSPHAQHGRSSWTLRLALALPCVPSPPLPRARSSPPPRSSVIAAATLFGHRRRHALRSSPPPRSHVIRRDALLRLARALPACSTPAPLQGSSVGEHASAGTRPRGSVRRRGCDVRDWRASTRFRLPGWVPAGGDGGTRALIMYIRPSPRSVLCIRFSSSHIMVHLPRIANFSEADWSSSSPSDRIACWSRSSISWKFPTARSASFCDGPLVGPALGDSRCRQHRHVPANTRLRVD
jgi:hypothetical protein